MARSHRFPLWHWIIFGGTFTAAVISMIAFVVALRFYRSRTGEAPGFSGSGVVAASPDRAAPPAEKAAPAAPGAEVRPSLPEPQEKMVFLAAPPPIQTLQGGRSYEMLRREIVRQAFLLSARDEFGLSTRDGAWREAAAKPLPETSQFHIEAQIKPGANAQVLVEQGGPAARKKVLQRDVPLAAREPNGYRPLTEAAEALSRREFMDALKLAGFKPRPHAFPAQAPLPAESAKRLDELIATSQFAALRQLHAAARAAGESPEILGALVRAYANLGILTEHLWLGGHRVFKARALLYAERLRQRLPKDPRGLWHRAYAETLIGLHAEALDDLRGAAELAGGAAPPEWVALLEPCCRFNADQLAKLADKPKLAQLAHVLHFLVVEDRNSLRLCLDSAQAILKENPDCTRVLDALCDIGGVGVLHQVTESYLEIVSRILPARVANLPGLPEALTARLRGAKSEAEFRQVLFDEGSGGAEEPSWSALGRILQEERFASIWRRVDFMRYQWGVPVDEFVQTAVPILKDHPYQDLIRSYSVDPQRDLASYLRLVDKLPVSNVDFSYTGLIRALSRGSSKWASVQGRALRQMDEDYRDLGVFLRSMNQATTHLEIARRLLKVSPHAGIAIATLLQLAAPPEQEVTAWEKDEGHQAIVLRGLAQLYSLRQRDADAERCWKAYLKRSPDFAGYRGLANLYKRQGKTDQWKATLDEYIKQGEQDLQHARIRVDIAEQLMADKKWREAKPYADEAAQTGAAWAMLCAHKCYEGLGEWDQAEQWVRRTAERYPNNTFAWFFWCWRTRKGDARAARQMVENYIQAQGGQLSANDTSHISVYYTLTEQRAKAFSYVKAMYERSKNAAASMLYALACDEAGDKKERDRIWSLFPGGDPVYTQLARLFRQCLERGEKSDVDAEEVQKILAKASPSLQADACYFVGDFLSCRGKRGTANDYLDRCATSSVGNPYIRLLAIARLREQKIEPGTLKKGGKNEP